MTLADDGFRPPRRLRELASWQANKVGTLGARLTALRMPLTARSDFAVLASLDEYGPLSQADIGRHLGLDRNDVNGILGRLQDAGHVSRRADPSDRRRNIVTITPEGARHLAELQLHADAVQDELVHGLTAAEQKLLRDLLAKMLDSHGPQPG